MIDLRMPCTLAAHTDEFDRQSCFVYGGELMRVIVDKRKGYRLCGKKFLQVLHLPVVRSGNTNLTYMLIDFRRSDFFSLKLWMTKRQNTLGLKWLFGRYQANLNAGYGDTGQALLATAFFWVIPWRLILALLLALLIVVLITLILRQRARQPTIVDKS